MLYGIIAAFDMLIFERDRFRIPGHRFQSAQGANSGTTVKYALTQRALLLQP